MIEAHRVNDYIAVVTIILTIVSILNIVLFFKIWLMTNNVEKILKHVKEIEIKNQKIGERTNFYLAKIKDGIKK